MADHPGHAFVLELPNFTQRNSSLDTWSSSITSASKPKPTSVVNRSSNLGLAASAFVPTITGFNIVGVTPTNHATTKHRGFLNNHKAPSDLETCGYDWFERVFIDPPSASIKVLNSTDLAVRTLSTHRHTQPGLTGITLDTGGGTSMTVEPSYVYDHYLLTYLETVFTATAAGPASYTGTITFDYDTGVEVFDITIVRVLDAPWRPLDKFTESLEWKTSIIAARNQETRAALREYPRLTYDYEFLLLGRELNAFRSAVRNAETPLITPLWYDEYFIGSVTAGAAAVNVNTTESEFVDGGYLYISEEGGENEFLLIATVGDGVLTLDETVVNNYTNATAMPATLTVVAKASYKEFNNDVYKGKMTLIGHSEIQRLPAAQAEYAGLAVLTSPSIIKKSLNASLSTRGKYLDNGVGIVRFKRIENRVRNSLDHLWKASEYESRKQMKDWIYSRVGRQKSFLVPTFQNDFYLAIPYPGGTEIETVPTQFEPPFHFQIKLNSGELYYGTCSTKNTDGGTDTLLIDALPQAFTSSDVDLFSIMFEQRYGSDKFQIKYTNHQVSELKTTVTGI